VTDRHPEAGGVERLPGDGTVSSKPKWIVAKGLPFCCCEGLAILIGSDRYGY